MTKIGRVGWITYGLAAAGALLAIGWLVASLLPAARDMMLDTALGFFMAVIVAALLWWAGAQLVPDRRFWRLLAAGWTVGLVGNVAWGVYELVSGQKLPYISLVDALYVARYGFVIAAFVLLLAPWTRRRLARLAIVVLLLVAVTVLVLFWPALPTSGSSLGFFLAGTIFPLLDAVLLPLVAWAWRVGPSRLRTPVGLLLLCSLVYAAANWLTFRVRVAVPDDSSFAAGVLWALSDILAGLAALWALARSPDSIKG